MLKTVGKKTAIGLAAAGIATTGTFSTLYVAESFMKNQQSQYTFAEINRLINSLPALADESKMTEAELIAHLQGKIDESGQDLHSVLIDHISTNLGNVNQSIQNSEESHELLKNEVQRQTEAFQKQLDLMKSGMVGVHDLNYYADALSKFAGQSQLDGTIARVESLEVDRTKLLADNAEAKTKVAAISTTVGDNTTGLVKEINDLVTWSTDVATKMIDYNTSSLKATNALAESNELAITRIEADMTAALAKIALVAKNADQNTDGVIGLQAEITKINAALAANGLSMTAMDNSIGTLENAVEVIQDEAAKVNAWMAQYEIIVADAIASNTVAHAAFKAEMDAFKAEFATFATNSDSEFKKVKDSIALVDKNLNDLAVIVNQNKTKIADLENLVASTNKKAMEEIATLKQLLADNSALIKDNSDKLLAVDTELTHFKDSIALVQQTIKDLEKDIADFQRGLDATNKTVGKILNTLDGLILEMDAAELRLRKAEDRLDVLEKATINAGNGSIDVLTQKTALAAGGLGNGHANRFILPTDWKKYETFTITGNGHGWNGEGVIVTNTLSFNSAWFDNPSPWGDYLVVKFFTNVLGEYSIGLNFKEGSIYYGSASYTTNFSINRLVGSYKV